MNVRLGPMRPDVLPSHEEMTTHHSDGKSMIDRYTYMHIYIYSFCQHAPGLGLTLTLLACQNPLASYLTKHRTHSTNDVLFRLSLLVPDEFIYKWPFLCLISDSVIYAVPFTRIWTWIVI